MAKSDAEGRGAGMKFTVHIRKKHARALVKQVAAEKSMSLHDVYVMALDIGLNALTAHSRGEAPKA